MLEERLKLKVEGMSERQLAEWFQSAPHVISAVIRAALEWRAVQVEGQAPIAEPERQSTAAPATLLLTYKEAGAQFRVSDATISSLVKNGKLHATYIGKSPRVAYAELQRFINAELESSRDPVGRYYDRYPPLASVVTSPPAKKGGFGRKY